MSRAAQPIILEDTERATLERWERGRSLPFRQVQRAKIILMASNCVNNQNIAAELGLSRPTVQLWRNRFLALRVAGQENDVLRPGRKCSISSTKILSVVEATLNTKPSNATQRLRHGSNDIHDCTCILLRRQARGPTWSNTGSAR